MISTFIVAIGLVLVFEGLVFALAPQRLEEIIAAISRMPLEQRRIIGLAGVALGVVIVWIAL